MVSCLSPFVGPFGYTNIILLSSSSFIMHIFLGITSTYVLVVRLRICPPCIPAYSFLMDSELIDFVDNLNLSIK